jgi:hypothetical protein
MSRMVLFGTLATRRPLSKASGSVVPAVFSEALTAVATSSDRTS